MSWIKDSNEAGRRKHDEEVAKKEARIRFEQQQRKAMEEQITAFINSYSIHLQPFLNDLAEYGYAVEGPQIGYNLKQGEGFSILNNTSRLNPPSKEGVAFFSHMWKVGELGYIHLCFHTVHGFYQFLDEPLTQSISDYIKTESNQKVRFLFRQAKLNSHPGHRSYISYRNAEIEVEGDPKKMKEVYVKDKGYLPTLEAAIRTVLSQWIHDRSYQNSKK